MSEWIECKVSELGEVISGATPKTEKQEYWDGDVIWITPHDMSKLRTPFVNNSSRKITRLGLNSCSANLLPKGSLVLSSRAPIGYFAIAQTDLTTNQGCKSIKFFKGHDPLFHYYNFLHNVERLKLLGEGTTFSEFSKAYLENFIVKLPADLAEQARIARILSTVDAAITQTEALIAKYGRVRTGLMQDLLTWGIDEHGQIRSEATHEFKDSSLGRVPVEWETVRLEQLLTAAKGRIQTGPFGSQLHSYEYVIEGVPVIMPQDIGDTEISTSVIARITEQKANSLRRHRVKVSDVLFSRRGDISRCAVITNKEIGWLCGTGCILMRLESNNVINPFWFKEYYQSAKAQTQVINNAVGLTMLNLNSGILYNLLIPAVPKLEQDRIVLILQKNQSNVGNHIAHLTKLKTFKKALMQDLLSGPENTVNKKETDDDKGIGVYPLLAE